MPGKTCFPSERGGNGGRDGDGGRAREISARSLDLLTGMMLAFRCVINEPEISVDPRVMGGKPCIRGTRVTVGCIVGQLGSGTSRERLLELYPYVTEEQIDACLRYAAWRSQEEDVPFGQLSA